MVMAIGLSLAACSPKPSQMNVKPDAPLDNTRWKMVKIDGISVFPQLEKDAFIQFNKENMQYRGNAGCNNFTGGYTVDGKKIKLQGGAMTRMMCPSPGMDVENIFSKAMSTIDNYQITGDHLILRSGNKAVAEFDALYLN